MQSNFSERQGISGIQTLQERSMTTQLSNDIYNFFHRNCYFDSFTDDDNKEIIQRLWSEFFHESITEVGTYGINHDQRQIKNVFDELNWNQKYDFLEYVLQNFINEDRYYKDANHVLECNNSGYRFIQKILVPITTERQQKSITKAIKTELDNGHLVKSLSELRKRKNTNYALACKEAIDAVEITANHIAVELFNAEKDKTLGYYVKVLKENQFIENHQAYLDALSKIYGCASDGGIRHPKDRDYEIDKADAVFLVEMCSAFISLLASKLSIWAKK